MASGTTVSNLKNNKCYCLKRDKIITLLQCENINCKRMDSCRRKTNNDINKELKK